MDIEERIEIRADLIYTGILDAVERLKNQSVDVFMEKVRVYPCKMFVLVENVWIHGKGATESSNLHE